MKIVEYFSYEAMDQDVHAFLRITQSDQFRDEALQFTRIFLDENRYEYYRIMLRLHDNLKLHRRYRGTIKFTFSFEKSVVSSRQAMHPSLGVHTQGR